MELTESTRVRSGGFRQGQKDRQRKHANENASLVLKEDLLCSTIETQPGEVVQMGQRDGHGVVLVLTT